MQKHGYEITSKIFAIAILFYSCFILPLKTLIIDFNPMWFYELRNSMNEHRLWIGLVFFIFVSLILLKILPNKKTKYIKNIIKYSGFVFVLASFLCPFFAEQNFNSSNGTDFYTIMFPLYLMLFFNSISVDYKTFKISRNEKNELAYSLGNCSIDSLGLSDYGIHVLFSYFSYLLLFIFLVLWFGFIGFLNRSCSNLLALYHFYVLLISLSITVIYILYNYFKNGGKLSGDGTLFANWLKRSKKTSLKSSKLNNTTDDGVFLNKNESTSDFWERMYSDYENHTTNLDNKNNSVSTNRGKWSKKLVKDNDVIFGSTSFTGEKIKEKNIKLTKNSDKNKDVFVKKVKERLSLISNNFVKNTLLCASIPFMFMGFLLLLSLFIDNFDYSFFRDYPVWISVLIVSLIIFLIMYYFGLKSKLFLQHIMEGNYELREAFIIKFIPVNRPGLREWFKNRNNYNNDYSLKIEARNEGKVFESSSFLYSSCSDIIYDDNEVLDNFKSLFNGFAAPVSLIYRGKEYKKGDKILVLIDKKYHRRYFMNFNF